MNQSASVQGKYRVTVISAGSTNNISLQLEKQAGDGSLKEVARVERGYFSSWLSLLPTPDVWRRHVKSKADYRRQLRMTGVSADEWRPPLTGTAFIELDQLDPRLKQLFGQ